MSELEFKNYVVNCGNTGKRVELPDNLDEQTCGNIMADVAGRFVDEGQDIKAIIILEERRRLGV